MQTATCVRENCEDIYADARQINEDRLAKEDETIIPDAEEA